MDDEREPLINAGTAVLGIRCEPEWRAAVRLHLDVILGHAAHVGGLPLGDETEPAPVFRA